jgi:hypothetical protein
VNTAPLLTEELLEQLAERWRALRAPFRLSAHPLARAELRRALRWRRITGIPPAFTPL